MSEIKGVVDGVYYCQQSRTEALNERLYMRNVPSRQLQPNFSMRPVSTKYDCMSIMDRRASSKIPIIEEPTYDIRTTFNPGNAEAPWSGFATNVNEESKLRNQFFALQNCEQANYVPSTTSDMYTVKVSGREEKCVFPNLVESGSNALGSIYVDPKLAPFNPNTCNIGKKLYNNHTRQQIMNIQ